MWFKMVFLVILRVLQIPSKPLLKGFLKCLLMAFDGLLMAFNGLLMPSPFGGAEPVNLLMRLSLEDKGAAPTELEVRALCMVCALPASSPRPFKGF